MNVARMRFYRDEQPQGTSQADFTKFFSTWKLERIIISGEFPRLTKAENGNEYGVLAFLGKVSMMRRVRGSRYLEYWGMRLSRDMSNPHGRLILGVRLYCTRRSSAKTHRDSAAFPPFNSLTGLGVTPMHCKTWDASRLLLESRLLDKPHRWHARRETTRHCRPPGTIISPRCPPPVLATVLTVWALVPHVTQRSLRQRRLETLSASTTSVDVTDASRVPSFPSVST